MILHRRAPTRMLRFKPVYLYNLYTYPVNEREFNNSVIFARRHRFSVILEYTQYTLPRTSSAFIAAVGNQDSYFITLLLEHVGPPTNLFLMLIRTAEAYGFRRNAVCIINSMECNDIQDILYSSEVRSLHDLIIRDLVQRRDSLLYTQQ